MWGGKALSRALVFLCWFLAGQSIASDGDITWFGPKLVEEQVSIPVQGGRYYVAATILRPEGPGPYGAVVLNHGVPVSQRERDSTSSAHFAVSAPVFARRGYVVMMPLRRGFGKTGGEFAEDAGPCSNPNFEAGEENAAADVMAAYDYARLLPYVDPSRMILAGQSAGAMASIFAAGTRAPRGLLAVLSFAGGRGGNPNLSPGVPCAIEPLAQVFDVLGKTVRAPVLFHYAQNDRYFSPPVTRQWYERFAAGGARAEYVVQPPFGDDGHFLFADLVGVRHWLPTVERFLAANGIPFERLDAADQVKQPLFGAVLPHVKSRVCQGLYRVFLESPGPRAYAISADGHCGFAGGMPNAVEEAVRQCGTMAKQPCGVYAENEAVVWKQGEPTFASIDAPQTIRR
jgi:dienelactone hydrolase